MTNSASASSIPASAVPILTIDGPSGSGKGTISRAVAGRLGWHYLDSGALYRAVGLAANWARLDFSDHAALVRLASEIDIRPPWLRRYASLFASSGSIAAIVSATSAGVNTPSSLTKP